MKVYLGADHAGFELKEHLKRELANLGYEAHDLGAYKLVPDDDYPAIARTVGEAVLSHKDSLAVLSCGNAVGVCVTANKTRGIRAGIGFSIDAARTMRNDDDANVLCIPGRIAIMDDAVEIAKVFLQTPFSGEERHVRRIRQIEI
ncbi:MAG: RpiB/LacA/LacB family sugar-phosphate isomerase [Patescibacteria group bacterium]